MAKQLNVNLMVSADTGQAKQALASLQQQLTQLRTNPVNISIGGQVKQEALEASKAIAQLQTSLKNSTNAMTGNLNLTQFNQSMQQAGMSLDKYQAQLLKMGPSGQKAFAQLANSIAQAEVPLRRTNTLFTELWISLKNTARWQLSSSLLHGFMGTIQGAYRYAQDLNKSLTDIQIVTQASSEHMAEFAKTANSAAKNLSTTTNSYAQAALIYYQQGLNDKEVKERTDATIKMANVTGQSAQKVSDQMTAIWNNFDDGSHSLEYYADVITALGAATASSSEEISKGLEKFAAIADTVGLSYENATAALATITATTRQSADTVGTGLRTLFSRFQSLSLGETLEDGVDLTKYSKALKTIGVDVLDANGNLRTMDSILEDMGIKWQTLTDAQKTATAQTVGGVRQYTTLMALMENFDFYKSNQQIAATSEGTLQAQQAIYEKSWAAASKRVRASAESIYSDLLDDKFFIKLTDGFSKFLDLIHNTIEGLGGLKGVLTTIGALMTTVFANKTANALQNIVYDLKMLTPNGKQQIQDLQRQGAQKLIDATYTGKDNYSQTMGTAYQQQGTLQAAYLNNAERMSTVQQQVARSLMEQQSALISNVELQAQAVQQAEQQATAQERVSKTALRDLYNTSDLDRDQKVSLYSNIKQNMNLAADLSSYQGEANSFLDGLQKIKNAGQEFNLDNIKQQLQDFPHLLEGFQATSTEAGDKFKIFIDAVNSGDLNKTKEAFTNLWDAVQAPMGASALDNIKSKIHALAVELAGDDTEAVKKFEQELDKLFSAKYKTGEIGGNLKQQTSGLISYTQQLKQAMQDLATQPMTVMDGFVAMAGVLSTIGMAINQINGLMNIWNNEQMSLGQKITATLTTLGMIIPMISRIVSAENIAKLETFGNYILNKRGKGVNTASNSAGESVKNTEAAVTAKEKAASEDLDAESTDRAAAAAQNKSTALGKESIENTKAATSADKLATSEIKTATAGKASGTGSAAAGKGAAAAGKGFAGLSKGLVAALGSMLLITAAIAAVVIAVKALDAAIETSGERTERLAKGYKDAQEAANNAKQAYDDLTNKINTHNQLLDEINTLTEGTVEFKQKLIEANQAAIDLINTYHLINGIDFTVDDNGAINFKLSSEAKMKEEALNNVQIANAQLMAAQNAMQMNDIYNISSDQSDIETWDVLQGLFGGIIGGSNSNFAKEHPLLSFMGNGISSMMGGIPALAVNLIGNHEIKRSQSDLESTAAKYGYADGDALIKAYNENPEDLLVQSGATASYRNALLSFGAEDGNISDQERFVAEYMASHYSMDDVERYAQAGRILPGGGGKIYHSGIGAIGQWLGIGGTNDLETLQNYYKSAVGDDYFDSLTDEQKKDKDFLRNGIEQMNTVNAMREDYQKTLEQMNDPQYKKYFQAGSMTLAEIQDMSNDLESRVSEKLTGLGANPNSLEGQVLRSGFFKTEDDLMAFVQQQREKLIGDFTSLGAKLDVSDVIDDDFVTNVLTGEDLEQINNVTQDFLTAFGKNSARFVFTALNQELDNGQFNKQLASTLSGLDLTGNVIEDLFTIKNTKELDFEFKNTENQIVNFRDQLITDIKSDIGGDAGILDTLFKSEDFADSLKTLQKQFKQTGKIGAKTILEMAKNSDTLAKTLDIVDANAQGVADGLAAIESGNISTLTNNLLAAFSAAGELKNNLAETFDFIDNYQEERSVSDIGKFFKARADAVQQGFESGMLLDEPVLQSLETMFGSEVRAAYQKAVYQLTDDNNLTPQQISDAINTQFSSQIAAMQSIQQNGNLSGMFKYLLDQNNDVFSQAFTYRNGQVVAANITDANRDYLSTQQGFIDFLMSQGNVPEEVAQAMAVEYSATNGSIAKEWRTNAAQEGIDMLLGKSEDAESTSQFLTGNEVRAFYDQYQDVLTEMGYESEDSFLTHMAEDAKKTGKTFVDLGEDFKFASASYKDFADRYNKSRSQQTGQTHDWLKQDLTDQGIVTENKEEKTATIDVSKAKDMFMSNGATESEAYAMIDDMNQAMSEGGEIATHYSSTIHAANGEIVTLTDATDSAQLSTLGLGDSVETFEEYCTRLNLSGTSQDWANYTAHVQEAKDALDAAQQQTDILAKAFVNSFASIEADGIDVSFNVDGTAFDDVKTTLADIEKDHPTTITATYTTLSAAYGVYKLIDNKTVEITYKRSKNSDPGVGPGGGSSASGYNNGKGFAGGKHIAGQYEGLAETGELGPELWIRDGQPYLTGIHGRTKIYVKPDDQIFTAAQTKEILRANPSMQDIPGFSVGYGGISWGGVSGSGNKTAGKASGSGANADNAKTSDYSPERYHLITRQLKDLQREYDELSDIKDNAYGVDKLKAIDAEIDATNRLIEGQKALVKEAEDYLKIDTERLKGMLAPGEFQVDQNGNLLNFEELQEKYRKAAEENKDDTHSKDVWKALEQYEETLDKFYDAQGELRQLVYQKMEARLEKITTKVELKINFDEKELKLLDHYINRLDDDIYNTAKVLALTETRLSVINKKIKDTKEGLKDIFNELSDKNGNKITKEDGSNYTLDDWLKLTDEQRKSLNINDKFSTQLEEYGENLLDYIEELEEFKTKGVEEVGEAFSELNTNVESSIELFDYYNSLLENLKNIVELQGIVISDNLKTVLDTINETMIKNIENNIIAEKEHFNSLVQQANDLSEKIKSTTDPQLKKAYEEELKKVEAATQQSVQKLTGLWQQGSEYIKERFEDNLNHSVNSFEKALSGMYENFDEFSKAWDDYKKIDDFYVKDYEKYYQIAKMSRAWTKDIENAFKNGSRHTKGMQKVLDDLNMAREEGAELTAYDLDVFSKRYEYEKALMELEDARNDKSEVRLQRDANGNWGYVYTSSEDEDSLLEKQQAVEDKLHDLQSAEVERVKQLQEDVKSIMFNAGKGLQELYASGASQDVIDDYIERTKTLLSTYHEGLQKALDDAGMTVEEAKLRYGEEGFEIVDSLGELLLSQLSNGELTIEQFLEQFLGLNNSMKQASQQYQDGISTIDKFFQDSGEDLATVVKGMASWIGDASDNTLIDSKEQIKNAQDTFTEILRLAGEFETEFMKIYQPIIDANEDLLQKVLAALATLNGSDWTPTITSINTNTKKIASGRTGMYTGTWSGSDTEENGRLAFLHQKELVLNKDDTKNFLASMDKMLNISSLLKDLEVQTLAFEYGFKNIVPPEINKLDNEILDQYVTIEANFPNATNHDEIEMAFDNLVNKASQYANRKNMSSMTFGDAYISKF